MARCEIARNGEIATMELNDTTAVSEFLTSLSIHIVTRDDYEWNVVILYTHKEKEFEEGIGHVFLYLPRYGNVVAVGLVPEGTKPKGHFIDTFAKDLIVRHDANDACYYLYIAKDKEAFIKDLNLNLYDFNAIRRYGKWLYFGWGRDPPEAVAWFILAHFFDQERAERYYKSEGMTELPEAARKRNLETFKLQLSQVEIDVEESDLNKWTLLHHASFGGEIKIIETLLEMKWSVHDRDNVGRKPIHIAAREGFVSVIKLFIGNGVDVDDRDSSRWTPLHYAAWGGHLPAVNILLDKGAEINAFENYNSATAIHLAAREGHTRVVEVLLRRGASINDVDFRGRTPLYYAAWRGQMSTVEFLVEHGADLYYRTCEKICGKMAIHIAAEMGHTAIVMFFIGKDKSLLDMQSSEGWTPLRYADDNDCKDTVKFLTDKGTSSSKKKELSAGLGSSLWAPQGNLNLWAEGPSNQKCGPGGGWTPVSYADCDDRKDTVKFSIDKGTSSSKENDLGAAKGTLHSQHNEQNKKEQEHKGAAKGTLHSQHNEQNKKEQEHKGPASASLMKPGNTWALDPNPWTSAMMDSLKK